MEAELEQVGTAKIPSCVLYLIYLVTVLLKNPRNYDHPLKAKPNFAVDSLHDIISLLQSTFTVKSEE